MQDELDNVWEIYGLRENPYSTQAILVLGGTVPSESFKGREQEISRLKKIIGAKGGSRVLVYGDTGVGKTSFVNIVRKQAYEKGFFTPFKEIKVLEYWDADEFVSNTLGSIYSSFKILGDRKPVSDRIFSKLEQLFEIGREERDFGLSLAGVGGNYSLKRSTQGAPNSVSLIGLFEEVISEIHAQTKKDVIIHYNNLELLPEQKVRQLFNNLRDFFQTEKVHFIFVGNLTVFENMQAIPRFASILSDTPIKIGNLTISELEEILVARMEAMRVLPDLNYIVPHSRAALQSLYELYDGNLRDVLNSLSTAVLAKTDDRAVALGEYELCLTLKEVLEKRFLSGITGRARDVLVEVIKHNEITNKSIAEKLKIASSNVSNYTRDLERQGCVRVRRKNGKDKFWAAEPHMKWYILEVNENRAKQEAEQAKQKHLASF